MVLGFRVWIFLVKISSLGFLGFGLGFGIWNFEFGDLGLGF